MKKFVEDWAVTACGAFTSILTALAVLLVHNLTGFNLFTFSFWLVIPVGALLTGFGAASGYKLGCLYFHHKPTKMMLLNMAVIAAGTQLLIYYMEYMTLVLRDGTKASDAVPFGTYMDVMLTSAKYSFSRTPNQGFEVGSFGYVLAGLQFLGFIVGGVCVYFHLASIQMCEKCKKYFRKLASQERTFTNYDLFKSFATKLYATPSCSPEYLSLIAQPAAVAKVEAGNVMITFTLHGCPECKQQYLAENVSAHNGKDWNQINDLARNTVVPEQQNLLPEFVKRVA